MMSKNKNLVENVISELNYLHPNYTREEWVDINSLHHSQNLEA